VDSAYNFTATGSDRNFELIVGRNDAIKERLQNVAPQSFYLSNNYPNPFNPATSFEYRLPHAGNVSFRIFNLAGQEIVVLVNGRQESGVYSITWTPNRFPPAFILLNSLRVNSHPSENFC